MHNNVKINTNYTPMLCVKTKLEAIQIIVFEEVGRRRTLFDLHKDRAMAENLINGVTKVMWFRERVGEPSADVTFFKNKLLEVKNQLVACRGCKDFALLIRKMRKVEEDVKWILTGVQSALEKIEAESVPKTHTNVYELQSA